MQLGVLRAKRYSRSVLHCPRCRSIYAADIDFCGIDGERLMATDENPLIGRVIERYEIVEVLAQGAMGSVYRVRHVVLEHEYAMKVLFGDLGASKTLVQRFRREAQAVSKIQHPNVVSVVDFGTTADGLTFLLMEYVEGETLERRLARDGPYNPLKAAQITRQIASGLAAAHRLGFVHRDIKPSNIMLSNKGGFDFVKILDFGIVGLAKGAVGDRLTESGYMVGTPLYMAPEQAIEAATVGPAADLYSLGVITFEMLMGRPPFSGRTSMEVVLKHAIEKLPPMPPLGGLEILVRWLLEKVATDRPKSGDEVVGELDRLSFTREAKPEYKPVSGFTTTVEMTVEQAWGGGSKRSGD
ncbi:MAG: serine/threonine protein kinase [Deltaproteobacteria bacterium]|nr:serine/threonine protein kinase [Deltaproteobacteria bacterium]